jgi:hypothetical protein
VEAKDDVVRIPIRKLCHPLVLRDIPPQTTATENPPAGSFSPGRDQHPRGLSGCIFGVLLATSEAFLVLCVVPLMTFFGSIPPWANCPIQHVWILPESRPSILPCSVLARKLQPLPRRCCSHYPVSSGSGVLCLLGSSPSTRWVAPIGCTATEILPSPLQHSQRNRNSVVNPVVLFPKCVTVVLPSGSACAC